MVIVKKLLLLLLFIPAFGLVFAQNVGIGTVPNASAKLHVSSNNTGVLFPNVSVGNVNAAAPVTAPATGLLVWNTNAAITGGSGVGYYYWNGTMWVWLGRDNVNNGLNFDAAAGMIQLGGPLVENTNIDQGAFGMTWNLNGTGDFTVQDAGVDHFQVRDNGLTYFGDDTYWNDGSVTGTTIARLYDSGDDGVFQVYMDGAAQHTINSIGTTVFNEQGTAIDFRVETDLQTDMFFIDGSTNRIGINTTAPAAPLQFLTTDENVWLLQWDNANAANGAAARFQNTNAGNPNRALMGLTNYSASAFTASAVIGLSLNNTTTGTGGVGVTGSANNESGTAVEGNLFFTGGYTGWAGYFNADVYSGGTYFGSDRRLKRDIKPVTDALDLVDKINPVSYYYDTEKYPQAGFDADRLTYGFIAQELETVVPEMVKDKSIVLNSNVEKSADMTSDSRETGMFKVVNYTQMIPILTQAIKEQQTLIEQQKQMIQDLQDRVTTLENN